MMLKKILKAEGVHELSKKVKKEVKGNLGYSQYRLSCVFFPGGYSYCKSQGQSLVGVTNEGNGGCWFPGTNNFIVTCK